MSAAVEASHLHPTTVSMRISPSEPHLTPELIPTPSVLSVTAAAAVESFYRSAMNSRINYVLTGVNGPFFPQMHVQLPVRVLYINGFKGVRYLVDDKFKPKEKSKLFQLGCAVIPGVVMTPISSILEACNANLNPEPLYTRWLRGITARCGREVIFGIGLNQLSEHFEGLMPSSYSSGLRNAMGSLMGGVVAGYLSHVPHNLSTMKLMNPAKSYSQLLAQFSEQRMPIASKLVSSKSPKTRRALATAISMVAPKGLLVRTVQVVGSFIILNGIINMMSGVTWGRTHEHDE